MTHEDARRLLEAKRSRLEGLRLGRSIDERGPGPSAPGDEPSSEAGNERLETELELSVSTQLETRLFDIEEALDRLAAGSWGSCERCGEPIAEERLQARPESRLCLDHQQEKDRFGRTVLARSDEPLPMDV